MNSQDYKDCMRDIKPSKELNDTLVNRLLNCRENTGTIHKKYKTRLAIICAVFLLLSGISVAASAWNLADIFKGYLKEFVSGAKDDTQVEINKNSPEGNTDSQSAKPIANNSAFLNTAGAIIEAADTEGGLKLTARGVVGDDRVLYIAVDVETQNGQAFTKEQEDNLYALNFQEIKMKIDDDVLGQYTGCTRIDDGSEKGKATYLIHDIINSSKLDEISGHRLTITFTNFLHTTNKLEDIGMEGNLYDIFTQFDKPADSDYQFYSVRGDANHTEEENKILEKYWSERKSGKLTGDEFLKRRGELIEAGLLEPLYTLPETSTKITFCTKYPKLEITNMGIKNNIFTFNIKMNDELDYKYLETKNLTLVNRKTGTCTNTTMDVVDGLEGGEDGKLISAHFVAFHTIASAEQLKDYYLAIGGYGAKDIINEGKWVLDFNLSYEDTTRSYTIDKKAVIAGFTGTIKSMDISPLSMKITYQADEAMNTENRALFEENWIKKEDNIYLMMKDGTKITDLSYTEDIQNGICTINTMFPYVIDLDQINKVIIDGTEIAP